MSTNCLVALKQENGYETIYVHWDGYLDGVGRTLFENYTTKESVAALIALGSCSKVFKAVNVDEVVAYHRDYGKLWSESQSTFYPKLEDFINQQYYIYVFQDDTWYSVTFYNKNLTPLRYMLMEYDELVAAIQGLWDDWNFGKGKQESKDLLDILCIERDARNILR